MSGQGIEVEDLQSEEGDQGWASGEILKGLTLKKREEVKKDIEMLALETLRRGRQREMRERGMRKSSRGGRFRGLRTN